MSSHTNSDIHIWTICQIEMLGTIYIVKVEFVYRGESGDLLQIQILPLDTSTKI